MRHSCLSSYDICDEMLWIRRLRDSDPSNIFVIEQHTAAIAGCSAALDCNRSRQMLQMNRREFRQRRDNADIAINYAITIGNTINCCRLYPRFISRLAQVAVILSVLHPRNAGIISEVARALFNATLSAPKNSRLTDIYLNSLRNLSGNYPDSVSVATRLAKAISNACTASGHDPERMYCLITESIQLQGRFPTSSVIRQAVAIAATHFVTMPAPATQLMLRRAECRPLAFLMHSSHWIQNPAETSHRETSDASSNPATARGCGDSSLHG